MENDAEFGVFKRAFRELVGSPLSKETLGDRIIAQKIAYLLNRKGLANLTYNEYNWYIHGVFNYDLWRSVLSGVEDEAEIPTSELERIGLFKQECKDNDLTGYFSDPDKMELITTILRTAKKQADLSETNSELIDAVIHFKNKFSEDEIKNAILKLKQINWNFEQ